MPKAVNKPTDAEAQQFDRYIQHWQAVLNLQDWRIEKGVRHAKGAMAEVECDNAARLAVYRLGDFGATPITTHSLRLTALHECLHVFLFDLLSVAQDRSASPEAVDAIEHRVINVLEKILGSQDDQTDG